MFFRTLTLRVCYRNAIPFTTSVLLAAVTAAWPRVREAQFHEGTSLWTMALLVGISTVFALVCGGRFRIFFITTAVTPPFLLVLPGWLRSMIRHPEYPITGIVEYLLYCVAAPILLVWIVPRLFERKEQKA